MQRTSDGEKFVAKVNKDQDTFEMAKEEADRLFVFSSRHIVKLVESFIHREDDVDKFVIIMEYCNLGDLTNLFRIAQNKPEYMPLFVRIINGVLQGLNVLHGTKQIHRDIKPLNVLLSGDFNDFKTIIVKLGDFGLARFVDCSQVVAMSKNLGTPFYFSPETLLEQDGGMPSDMWAVGVTFHQMLSETGKSPFLNTRDWVNGNPIKLPAHVPDFIA